MKHNRDEFLLLKVSSLFFSLAMISRETQSSYRFEVYSRWRWSFENTPDTSMNRIF
jgi:hypothetical protein